MIAELQFPHIDPVVFFLFGWPIHWYGLAYIVGMVLGWRYGVWMASRPPTDIHPANAQEFVLWLPLALVLGARLGHFLFYQPATLFETPLALINFSVGGMSFHGGLIAIGLAAGVFCWRRRLPFFHLADVIVAVAPIGLLLGRIGNFINGELYGRPSQLPWAMIFPKADELARHPSQLYEAFSEGLLLLVLFWILETRTQWRRRSGVFSGIFLVCYGLIRIICEVFRAPEELLGNGPMTIGQVLSLPMVLVGITLIVWRSRHRYR